jgi:hypothetical protein
MGFYSIRVNLLIPVHRDGDSGTMMTVKSAFGFTLQQLRSGRNFHCGRNGLISQYIDGL